MKKDVKIYKKMIDRPPLLEEPFAQTLSGIKILQHEKRKQNIPSYLYISICIKEEIVFIN